MRWLSMREALRRLACAIGWHVPKLRSDMYGYYLGCAHCDFADTPAIGAALLSASKGDQSHD
jgi:hypothetical protein